MTGIFDSGVGGLTALKHLRRLKPDEDICYYADERNAPYGSKSERRIMELVKKDIDLLRSAGCERILAACCTASAVIPKLPEKYREGVTAIIDPTAEEAVRLTDGRVGVIATEATVRCGAFESAIKRLDNGIQVASLAAQPLVAMVESGDRDGCCTEECREYLSFLSSGLGDIDLLILGCTHFTHLEKTIADVFGVMAISPSLIGAQRIAEEITCRGAGKTVIYK